MTIRLHFRWLLLPVLLLSLQLSHAQAPQGTNSVDLGNGVGNPLWDLSGDYNLDMFVDSHNTETEVQIGAFTMLQDGRGRLSAAQGANNLPNSTSFQIGQNVYGVGSYTIHGMVTTPFGSVGDARAQFILTVNGTAQFGNSPYYPVTITAVVDAVVDANSQSLIALKPVKVSVRFQGINGSFSGKDLNFSASLPSNVTGIWNLTLDIGSVGTMIHGTAQVTTYSSRVFDFTVDGQYNPMTGISTLKLKDAGTDQPVPNGANFTVFLDSEGNLLGMKGKVLGQKVDF